MPTTDPLRVAFLVNDLSLSGGMSVIVEHARHLNAREDFTVSLVLVRELQEEAWRFEALAGLEILGFEDARAREWDIVLSGWWETAYRLFELRSARYASFVQSLEDRFYVDGKPERLGASLALDLPVSFVTEATWIKETLAQLRPGAPCHLVRNGIDKDVFAPVAAVPPDTGGPLRVLIEGNPRVFFKGVAPAVAAAQAMTAEHVTTLVTANRKDAEGMAVDRIVGPLTQRELAELYAASDVLLKLSTVEGMFGPPLEAFHKGATCVVSEVTGHDEYVRHMENGLVVDWDDTRGTARALDLLARDRALLRRLREGALQTARDWPSWDDQGPRFAEALHAIATEPPADPYDAARAMSSDLLAAQTLYAIQLAEREALMHKLARWDRIKRLPVIAPVLRQWNRPRVQRHIAPKVMRRLKRASGV